MSAAQCLICGGPRGTYMGGICHKCELAFDDWRAHADYTNRISMVLWGHTALQATRQGARA